MDKVWYRIRRYILTYPDKMFLPAGQSVACKALCLGGVGSLYAKLEGIRGGGAIAPNAPFGQHATVANIAISPLPSYIFTSSPSMTMEEGMRLLSEVYISNLN